MLTVGQLAEASGVPATTLRYYDHLGLLVPARLPNGHRRYPREAVERLHLVRLCQTLGLSLDEVAAVLGPGGGARRRAVARHRLEELERTMAQLAAAHAVLTHFAECRHTTADAQDCEAVVRSAWSTARPTSGAGAAAHGVRRRQ